MENKKLSVFALIVIPIIAILTSPFYPAIYEYFFPKTSLTYEVSLPVKVNSSFAFNLSIENNGFSPEKNIKVEFSSAFYNGTRIQDVESAKDIKKSCSRDGCTVSIGDLKSKENFSASFIVEKSYLTTSYDGSVENIKVSSDDRIAQQVYDDPFFLSLYKYLFWLPLAFLGIILVISAVISIARTPEDHINYHQSQIKEFRKKISAESKKQSVPK